MLGGGGRGGGADDFSDGGRGGGLGDGWGLGPVVLGPLVLDIRGGRQGLDGDLDLSCVPSGLPNEDRTAGVGLFRISTLS